MEQGFCCGGGTDKALLILFFLQMESFVKGTKNETASRSLTTLVLGIF